MSRILIASALLALTVLGLVEMMILVRMETVHNALLGSFDIGFPILETAIATMLLAYLVRRHPGFRRLPIRARH